MLSGLLMTGQELYNEQLSKKVQSLSEEVDTSSLSKEKKAKLQKWLASGATIDLHLAQRLLNTLPKNEDKSDDSKPNEDNKVSSNLAISQHGFLSDIVKSPLEEDHLNSNESINSKLLLEIVKAVYSVKQSIDGKNYSPILDVEVSPTMNREEPKALPAPTMVREEFLALPAPVPTPIKAMNNDNADKTQFVQSSILDTLRDIEIGQKADRKDEYREDEIEDNRWDRQFELLSAIADKEGSGGSDSSSGLLENLLGFDFGGDSKGGKGGKGGKLSRVLGGAKNLVKGAGGMAVRAGGMAMAGAGKLGALAMANPITAGLLAVGTAAYGGYKLYDHFRGSEESKAILDSLEEQGVIDHDIIGDSEILDWKAIEALKPENLKHLIEYDDFSNEDTQRMKDILAEKEDKDGSAPKEVKTPKSEKKTNKDYSEVDEVKKDSSILDNLHKVTPMGMLYEAMRGSNESKAVFDQLVADGVIDHDWLGDSEILDWEAIKTLKPDMLQNLIEYDDFDRDDISLMQDILAKKRAKEASKTKSVGVSTPTSKVKTNRNYDKVEITPNKWFIANLHKVTPIGFLYEKFRGSEESKAVFDQLVADGVIDHDWLGDSEILDWEAIKSLKPDYLKALIEYDDFSEHDLGLLQAIMDKKKSQAIKTKVETVGSDEASKGKNNTNVMTSSPNKHSDNKPAYNTVKPAYSTVKSAPQAKEVKYTIKKVNPKVAGGSVNPNDYKLEELFNFHKTSPSDLAGIDKNVLSNLKAMGAEYLDKFGHKIQINSAFRSFEEQARLKKSMGSKAASPGSSMHNYGMAVDMNSSNAENAINAGLFSKYGFHRPIAKETWHVEPAGIDRAGIRTAGMAEYRKTGEEPTPQKVTAERVTVELEGNPPTEDKLATASKVTSGSTSLGKGMEVETNGEKYTLDTDDDIATYAMLSANQDKSMEIMGSGKMGVASNELDTFLKSTKSKEQPKVTHSKLDIPSNVKKKPKSNAPSITGPDSQAPVVAGKGGNKGNSEPTVISAPSTTVNNVYNVANEFLGSSFIARKWGV